MESCSLELKCKTPFLPPINRVSEARYETRREETQGRKKHRKSKEERRKRGPLKFSLPRMQNLSLKQTRNFSPVALNFLQLGKVGKRSRDFSLPSFPDARNLQPWRGVIYFLSPVLRRIRDAASVRRREGAKYRYETATATPLPSFSHTHVYSGFFLPFSPQPLRK